MSRTPRVILLIDTDHTSFAHQPEIESHVRILGKVVRRLAVGRPDNNWKKKPIPKLEWIQESTPKSGKNAADIALTGSAMRLLLTEDVDCFCIVAGDSDYTWLARELRKEGKIVVGIASKKNASDSFRNACNSFRFIGEAKKPEAKDKTKGAKPSMVKQKRKPSQTQVGPRQRDEFPNLVGQTVGADWETWRSVGWLGKQLRRIEPGIRYSTYGKRKLSDLVQTFPAEIETRGTGNEMEFRLRKQPRDERTPEIETPAEAPSQASEAARETQNVAPLLSEDRIDMRWNMAVLGARWGWAESLPKDLAELSREEWDGTVREAEERWCQVTELRSEVAEWIRQREKTGGGPEEGDEFVFYAGDMPSADRGGMFASDLGVPELYVVAMPTPVPIAEIWNDEVRFDEGDLWRNPIIGAIRHQHADDVEQRRLARQIIAITFSESLWRSTQGKHGTDGLAPEDVVMYGSRESLGVLGRQYLRMQMLNVAEILDGKASGQGALALT